MFSYGPWHIDMPMLVNQQEITYNSSVRKQDKVWKTSQKQWMIEMDGEKENQQNLC